MYKLVITGTLSGGACASVKWKGEPQARDCVAMPNHIAYIPTKRFLLDISKSTYLLPNSVVSIFVNFIDLILIRGLCKIFIVNFISAYYMQIVRLRKILVVW